MNRTSSETNVDFSGPAFLRNVLETQWFWVGVKKVLRSWLILFSTTVISTAAYAVPDFGTRCTYYYTASEGENEAFMFLANSYHDYGATWPTNESIQSTCPVSSTEVYEKGYLFQVTAAQCIRPSEISGDGCVTYKGPAPIDFVFFNGVFNDIQAATRSGYRIAAEFPGPYKGASVTHTLFYNPTACRDGLGVILCFRDIAQTFVQRSDALDGILRERWETFWEIIGSISDRQGSFTMSIGDRLGSYYVGWLELIDSITNSVLNKATGTLASLAAAPPTKSEVSTQANQLLQMAKEHHSFFLLAHSQGNLYQKAVLDEYQWLSGRDSFRFFGMAGYPAANVAYGIAPPVTSYIGGILADIDLVINGLRVLGVNSVPLSSISIPFSRNDISGHTLEATYLDKSRPAYDRIQTDVTQRLNYLMR